MKFDTVLMVDWSGGNDRGLAPKKDAIWTCVARGGVEEEPIYHRNRQVAEAYLIETLQQEWKAGRRTLAAFDLCFAFPDGFGRALTGSDDPLAVWDWFEQRVEDGPKANNRYQLAGQINAMFGGVGPFWFKPDSVDAPDLPAKGSERTNNPFAEKRAADLAAKGAFSPWQLGGAGAVGGQVIMGMPVLSRLRARFGADLAVWPFQQADPPIVLAETYFSLLPEALKLERHAIKDAAQVALFARTFSGLDATQMAQCLDVEATNEGWVLGVGHEAMLRGELTPPPLQNDCFAMPRGANWVPVDDVLQHIQGALTPIAGAQNVSVPQAAGRILASDAVAVRSHPPHPNSAVDGYALAGPIAEGAHQLPLVKGRSAAGAPFDGVVPKGSAIRILTGANIPDGTDTVILQEDVTSDGDFIAFHGPLKMGANARKAGEDMVAGDVILTAGRRLTAADLGTLTAAGVALVSTFAPLRVGVLSTGDELRDASETAHDGQIYDANRPMLLASLRQWGFEAVDLGRAPDDRETLAQMLSQGATQCDAILTSGGASAGDEDHVSALLQGTGSFALWRIAVKPGRPMAMGIWDGTPVFGLPGNPVAAQVCASIFALPALTILAGGTRIEPPSFMVPAAFVKSKKAGRREYLRARMTWGAAEIFTSEGSGRVSGLSWSTGLVELPDEAVTIERGTLVKYLPYSGFGS